MVKQVNIHHAKTHLSALLEDVQKGDEVVIARNGKPVARLVKAQSPKQPRKPGSAKGKIWMSDEFDAPLPKKLLDLFYK